MMMDIWVGPRYLLINRLQSAAPRVFTDTLRLRRVNNGARSGFAAFFRDSTITPQNCVGT